MWRAKGLNFIAALTTEGIVQAITQHAEPLIQKWGEENAPPPAHIYSLDNHKGGGLHVVQKTFQGEFEVVHLMSCLI